MTLAPTARLLLVVALIDLTLADLATTAAALVQGAHEVSPGGAMALATAGFVGLLALKAAALAVVWLSYRLSRNIGAGVAIGLLVLTMAAVVNNLAWLCGCR